MAYIQVGINPSEILKFQITKCENKFHYLKFHYLKW